MENIDFQVGMNMKAWQNPYCFAHEYFGEMNYESSKGILDMDVTNKDTLDIIDKNILKYS